MTCLRLGQNSAPEDGQRPATCQTAALCCALFGNPRLLTGQWAYYRHQLDALCCTSLCGSKHTCTCDAMLSKLCGCTAPCQEQFLPTFNMSCTWPSSAVTLSMSASFAAARRDRKAATSRRSSAMAAGVLLGRSKRAKAGYSSCSASMLHKWQAWTTVICLIDAASINPLSLCWRYI